MYREKLLKKLDGLNEELSSLMKGLEPIDAKSLNTKPDPETWSPMQILNHLVLAEKLSLAYCKKKLSFDPDLNKANLRTSLNDKIVSWALISPVRFKAPRVVDVNEIVEDDTLQNVLGQWTVVRQELKDFIESTSDKYIDCEVYKHPFGLRLSLGGMLDFYKHHFRRHRRQLLRRLN